MTPKKDESGKGLGKDAEDRPLPGQPASEPRSETRGIPLDTAEERQVRDKPYPLEDTKSDISGGDRGRNAYHETGGPAGRLDRENADALPESRRESRERVSPEGATKEPTQEPSGKHTNQ